MEKKESPKKANELKLKPEGKGAGKPSWISNKVFDIIKLILGICLLPFAYSCTAAFLKQVTFIDSSLQNYFWSGVITFLLVYLFIWEMGWVYERGHKLLELVFSFFQPFVRVAPYLLPIYTIVIFIIYLILAAFIKEVWLANYTMFLLGFSIILHLVFSSKAVRSKKGDILKSNYIFGFSFIYIINLGALALFLNIILKDFSFVSFCNSVNSIAGGIFHAIFSQFFVV
ncbi:MAG: hypothetical protein WC394_00460 [Candidatus Omnitrophota bacterium]|jgi:hypothetical protein